jgi:hypothetical protein
MSDEGPWEAGAIGRIPDDDSLVYRDDAVTGAQFYARTVEDAVLAARRLNELEAEVTSLRAALIVLARHVGDYCSCGVRVSEHFPECKLGEAMKTVDVVVERK